MTNARMVTLLLAGASAACTAAPEFGVQAASLTEVTSFGSNPGKLRMYTYTPTAMPSGPAPLVVVLHGCTQTAADYVNAGWNELADLAKFYVVYAEQGRATTPRSASTGIVDRHHPRRGRGAVDQADGRLHEEKYRSIRRASSSPGCRPAAR